ncbi:hypothetical protein [Arthrobacter sp. Leaf234]|uniref:hypothetical protein n=1 Tax=Arthrobacter sp. Leaf234 TaxID=1736303 RepID=UPI000A60CAB9|nr:hypothetical protein [Arthrobacter sp. Leaf234]
MAKTHPWPRVTFLLGASLIALVIAARRLGWGTGDGDEGPALWLALLFIVGAVLLLAVLVRTAVLVRRRK